MALHLQGTTDHGQMAAADGPTGEEEEAVDGIQ